MKTGEKEHTWREEQAYERGYRYRRVLRASPQAQQMSGRVLGAHRAIPTSFLSNRTPLQCQRSRVWIKVGSIQASGVAQDQLTSHMKMLLSF